ncbi:MAG: sulfite exporter TauE/SafE family protein, partial [Patescibacteria group bacterium]|nr:sulfite exporter TauE/SafE family protein [Patescibacteria group bacterium]
MENAIVFTVAFIATLLSSMSGGGTGIIIYPVFLSMGMSYPLVSATASIMSGFWVLPASRNYLKGRSVDWAFIVFFSLIGLLGAYLAVLLITSINQRALEIGVGVLILFLVAYTYFRKEFGLTEHRVYSRLRQMLAYPFALLSGFYEIVFGAGNGIAVTMLTLYTKGFDFIDGLGH